MTTKTVAPAGLWVLRVTGMIFLLGVVGQAALAGLFVTGDVGFLDMHAVTAVVIAVSVIVWIAAALVLRSPRGVVIAGVAALLFTIAQIAAGFMRLLPLHMPLGVLMVIGALRLVTVAFAGPEGWK